MAAAAALKAMQAAALAGDVAAYSTAAMGLEKVIVTIFTQVWSGRAGMKAARLGRPCLSLNQLDRPAKLPTFAAPNPSLCCRTDPYTLQATLTYASELQEIVEAGSETAGALPDTAEAAAEGTAFFRTIAPLVAQVCGCSSGWGCRPPGCWV